MAQRYGDMVKENAAAPGTGTVTLGGAATGFLAFSSVPSIATGDTLDYMISDAAGTTWEVGTGTYNSTGTLARTTVLINSSGTTSLVNFAGAVTVRNVLTAERVIAPIANGITTIGTTQTLTLTGGGTSNIASVKAQSGSASGTSCTISGTVLTVGGTITGTWAIGQVVTGTSVTAGSVILSFGTGTGGAGTYNLSASSTVSTATTITGTFNVSVVVQPSGGGYFSLQQPDSTAVGGNARGAGATDLQVSRGSASQVASGANAFVAGQNNTASGAQSVAMGVGNSATGQGAVALGNSNSAVQNAFAAGVGAIASGSQSVAFNFATASGSNAFAVNGATADAQYSVAFGQFAHTNGKAGAYVFQGYQIFGSTNGGSQKGYEVIGATSTSTSANRLTANGGAASSSNIVNLANNSALSLLGVTVTVRDTTTGDVATFYLGQGISLKRGANAAATSIVGTPVWTAGGTTAGGSTTGMTAASISLTADTTNGGINLSVTCGSANATHIIAAIDFSEVQ